jgi:hypothetical protein
LLSSRPEAAFIADKFRSNVQRNAQILAEGLRRLEPLAYSRLDAFGGALGRPSCSLKSLDLKGNRLAGTAWTAAVQLQEF